MRRMALLALAIAVPLSVSAKNTPPPECDRGGSFAGGVISDAFVAGTVKLEWTLFEDSTVREYRVSRRPASCDGSSCGMGLAKLTAKGDAVIQSYVIVDTAPPGAWIYRLEVRRSHGTSCVLETDEIIVPISPPCDSVALCAQVEAHFGGEVILGLTTNAVELRWLTHAETGSGTYRLSRFNCANSRDCSTEVATVDATGTCGQVVMHSVTDSPPAGAWTYELEVLDAGGRKACAMRLPEPASVSSR